MVSSTVWILFNVVVLIVLLIDLFVIHRKPHETSIKEASILTAIYIFLALVFNIYIYFAIGQEAAIQFFTAYLIEKSLSVDNLFVFLLIFQYFKTPATSLHKVLFWGILGAIVTRALFIFLGLAAIQLFHAIIYVFGLFLIITGLRLLFNKGRIFNPETNILIRLIRRFVPITDDYHDDHFLVRQGSKKVLTPLFVVLIVIESTDILFAIDSIPAVLAITFNPFIAYTSNVCAIIGLRSLFFVLVAVADKFQYLYYGISAILVLIGVKMLLSDIWPFHPLWSLVLVTLILLISIIYSIRHSK